MSDLTKQLGRLIRGVRESHGISQDDLAMGAGTSRVTISSIESGKTETNIGMLARIAKELGTDLATLFQSLGPELPRSETQAVRASQIAPGPGTAPASPERENDEIRAEIISLLPALDHLELLQLRSEARGLARARAFLQKRSE